MNQRRFFWLMFFGLMFLFAGSVVWYTGKVLKPYPPTPEALAALESTPTVQVQKTAYGWDFIPSGGSQQGLAFYPGGLVDPRAYAPVLQQIAAAGIQVALLELRFNLAVTEQGKARQPIAKYPNLRWAVGGHSLGGVVASNFAASNPDAKALVLWASYPQNDLSSRTLPTLALFGSQDGLNTPEKLAPQLAKFPKGTQQQTLQGLNHAGFGAYGSQRGDQTAKLSPQEGWKAIRIATVEFLQAALR